MLDSFLKILAGETPDRIVWTADITYWMSGRRQDGTFHSLWETEEGYLRLHRDLGILPYYYYETFLTGLTQFGPGVEWDSRRDGNRSARTMRTPVGTVTEECAYLPESACQGVTRHFVSSEGDLDVLLYALERRHWEPANLAGYDQRQDLWRRYDGLPALGLPRSPLSALCYEWCGVEALTYLTVDCPGKVYRALELMEEQERVLVDAVCELAPPLIHFPDNLSSDNLTFFYDDHMAAGHRSRLARLHAAGVKAAVHLDGTVAGLLPKLVASGFDAVEALTPAPVGDLDAAQIREAAASTAVVLWGGVPGAMFAPPYTWKQMEAHIDSLLAAWEGQPFIVGVADQVPPDGDIGFCRRIAKRLKD